MTSYRRSLSYHDTHRGHLRRGSRSIGELCPAQPGTTRGEHPHSEILVLEDPAPVLLAAGGQPRRVKTPPGPGNTDSGAFQGSWR